MLGQRLRSVVQTGMAGLLLLTLPALASAVDVRDDASFFSADAVEKANTQIREIEKRTGREIRIETYATVPV